MQWRSDEGEKESWIANKGPMSFGVVVHRFQNSGSPDTPPPTTP